MAANPGKAPARASRGFVLANWRIGEINRSWISQTVQAGYVGNGYINAGPDVDQLYTQAFTTTSPQLEYTINFTTTGTYYVWLRGYAPNAAGDSVYVALDDQSATVLTGLPPRQWTWANTTFNSTPATLPITTTGLYTLSLWMREDGLRLDRLLLTTDTTYLPAEFGPAETARQATGAPGLLTNVDRVIEYDYDQLYHLTGAAYSSGEAYQYGYDPVGNRLRQIIDGDTTDYQYDAANRLEQVSYQSTVTSYQFDANGNLLHSDAMTNTWDAANRLIETSRQTGQATNRLTPVYDGLGNRVAQTIGSTTTTFALDVALGLPEVIYTSEGNAYLHLPGVIMTENSTGEVRYLLGDGLGSVRQAVDDTTTIVAYNDYDPYGNPVSYSPFSNSPFAYTGEWWENEVGLLHLRARWYLAETGTFLSRDAVENEPPYLYVRGNPVNQVDPSGLFSKAAIEASLGGKSIQEAFGVGKLGRAGFYHLLRDAKHRSLVSPYVIDFGTSDHSVYVDRYPLREPKGVGALLLCDNYSSRVMVQKGNMIASSFKMDLANYLNILEIVAQQQETVLWRDDTMALHYYGLYESSGSHGFISKYVGVYDDFGIDNTQLPDAIGIFYGATIKVGLNGSIVVDRYGNQYGYIGMSGGYGLPVAFGTMEGYYKRLRTKRADIPSEADLIGSLGGQDVNISLLKEMIFNDRSGYEISVPLPGFILNDSGPFLWLTRGGLAGGISWGIGFSPQGLFLTPYKSPELAWNWLDDVEERAGFSFDKNSLDIEDSRESGNECNCD